MISSEKIKNNFSRVARSYDKYADIQSGLAIELLERVVAEGRKYTAILDIGCGTGALLGKLEINFPSSIILGLDISLEMAKIADSQTLNSLVADAADLPFHREAFDAVISNVVYQWVPGLAAAFKEAFRVLKKEGRFIFNCFGFRTLEELRACFGIEENILPTKELFMDSLVSAGFSDIRLEVELRNKYFDNLVDILSWLKYIGANRIYSNRPLLTSGRLARANHFYCSNYRSNGKVYATFEVIKVSARKNA